MDDGLTQADRHMIEAVLIKVSGWKELTTSDLVPDRPCDDIGLDLQRRCTELVAELDGVREFMVVALEVEAVIDRLYSIGEAIEGFHDYVLEKFANDSDDSAAAWKSLMLTIDKVIADARSIKGEQIKALTKHESEQYGLWKQMKERLTAEGKTDTMQAVYDALVAYGQLQDGVEFGAFKQTVNRARRKRGEGRRPKMDKYKGSGSIDTSRYKPLQDQDDTVAFQPDDN